jgi:DNA-binding transcriptional MerR regulator
MQDLAFPFLTPRVVSGLTGLSTKTLRRWEEEGIPPVARARRGRQPGRRPRLYSWREVEQLQRVTHLLKTTRLSLAEVKRVLTQSQGASLDGDWVIARPKPRVRRRVSGGAAGLRNGPTRRMR